MMRQRRQRQIFLSLSLILAIAVLILAWPHGAIAQSAREAFRQAYEHRYTWNDKFPGYSAEVSVNYQGKLDQGIVRVTPSFTVDTMNLDSDEVRELIVSQLQMELTHRKQVPFEQLHGQNQFELEGTDASGGLKIREIGDRSDSHYQVKNNVVTQVNRRFDNIAVTVDTIGVAKNPEGYLVTQFQTTFRDADTDEVLEKQDVRDFHEKIGNWYLLTYRAIRSTPDGNPGDKLTPDTIIRFNSIQPLRMPGGMVSPV